MFDGYLALGGTEIINSERLKAYVAHVLPTLPLSSSCCDCDTLAEFLGDAPYTSPLQDEPPWWSPFRTESSDFLGVLPLSLEGFDNSTREVGIVQTTGDGSVAGRPRLGSREMRATALLVATTEKGLDLGMSWLRDALAGSGCAEGDCSGDDLCYLAACPEICEDDLLTDVLDVDIRNIPTADRALEAAEWSSSTGAVSVVYASGNYTLMADGLAGPSTLSRTITGLTPGAVYHINVSMMNGLDSGAATYMDLEVAGSSYSSTSPRIFGPTGAYDTSGAFLEFVATSPTHRIVITPRGTVFGENTVPARIYLAQWSVTRVAQRNIVMAGRVSSLDAGSSYAWTPAAPAGYNRLWESSNGGLTWTAVGAQVPNQHTLTMTRTIQGLVPGHKYRIRLAVRALRTGTTTPTAVGVAVKTTEGAWNDFVGTPPGYTTSSGSTAWVTYEFTAASTTTSLQVSNGSTMTMASGATYTTQIFYMRVEENIDTQPIEPILDPSRPLRTLRNVTTTSGPYVTEVYPPRTAYMQKVEWTMDAGAPRPVGEPIPVTRSLGLGNTTVPEIDCVNGQQVQNNLIVNPSFETNTTGWSNTGTGWGAVTQVSDTKATQGTYVGRITATAATSTPTVLSTVLTGLMPGSAYTFSLDGGSSVSNVNMLLRAQGTTWGAVGTDVPLSSLAAGTRKALTFYIPPDHTGSVTLSATFTPMVGSVAIGAYVWADAALLTNTAYATPYFDGSTLGGTWNGTAHGSASKWTNPIAATVVDPDCPPVLAPPRPPVVIDSCVLPPDLWLRYPIDVPAELTQRGLSAFPAVTLTTGSLAARGVRVRFYANPFSVPADQIDPCSYCGEFVLSYLPPNGALTVDTSLRDAWLVVNGQRQTAMSLLYGSDGGPLTWPEMTCGVPYLMAVDLDADTSPLIGLALDVIPAF